VQLPLQPSKQKMKELSTASFEVDTSSCRQCKAVGSTCNSVGIGGMVKLMSTPAWQLARRNMYVLQVIRIAVLCCAVLAVVAEREETNETNRDG